MRNRNLTLLLLFVFVLMISGCGVSQNINKTEKQATPSSWPVASLSSTSASTSSSTIYKNDLETWSLFEYNELEFSMKLPFESNTVNIGGFACTNKVGNVFTYIYEDCEDSSRQDYTYNASINFPDGSIGDYLGSISAKYVNGDRERMFGWLKDFYRQGNNYVMGKLIFHPIKIVTIQKVPIIIYDAKKDLGYGHPAYGAIFNLPANKTSNKKFKATAIQFYEDDLPLEQFVLAIKSIRFFNIPR